jgi:hypothetical protein
MNSLQKTVYKQQKLTHTLLDLGHGLQVTGSSKYPTSMVQGPKSNIEFQYYSLFTQLWRLITAKAPKRLLLTLLVMCEPRLGIAQACQKTLFYADGIAGKKEHQK